MEKELITISDLVDIIIHHDLKIVELNYYRSCKVSEAVQAMFKLQAHPDGEKIMQYQFKA